ncbi:MAG: hypothetical protein IH623_23795 [Verrucomicrobia bacterium]|nr:hypothetical protein [Verrucomicrobiota bacterium]
MSNEQNAEQADAQSLPRVAVPELLGFSNSGLAARSRFRRPSLNFSFAVTSPRPNNMSPEKTKQVSVSITEVTHISGKTTKIVIVIDEKKVTITVPVEIKAFFDSQFSRPNPSALQKKKYATVMNLMKAAYLQGRADAKE